MQVRSILCVSVSTAVSVRVGECYRSPPRSFMFFSTYLTSGLTMSTSKGRNDESESRYAVNMLAVKSFFQVAGQFFTDAKVELLLSN